LLAGIAGAEVDKLAETKGMDFIDREKAKRHAKENAEHLYDEHYVRGQGADQYDPYVALDCTCRIVANHGRNQYDAPQSLNNY